MTLKLSRILNFVIILLQLPLYVYADGWISSQPSHSTLYADTLTSKTDASPVSIADSQGLFVTGNITTLGNVGIGTTNPTSGYKLHVAGPFKTSGEGYANFIRANGEIQINPDWATAGTFALISTVTNMPLSFSANSDTVRHLTIATSGNVGIGTTNPGANLHVSGSGSTAVKVEGFGGQYTQLATTWGTPALKIFLNTDPNGPPAFLNGGYAYHGASLTTNTYYSINPANSWQTPVSATAPSWALLMNSCGAACGASGDHFEISRAAPTSGTPVLNTLFYISSSGNIGIGTTNPGDKVDVNGIMRLTNPSDSSTYGQIYRDGSYLHIKSLGPGNNVNIDSGNYIYLNGLNTLNLKSFGADYSSNNWGLWVDKDTHNVLLANTGGNVGIGTTNPGYKLDVAGDAHATSFPTSSDIRLKKNISQITNALDKLQNIHGVKFEWNEKYKQLGRATNGTQIGIVAQELEKEFPELVTTWGNESYKAVDYGRLSAVLLEAIKELKKENERLKEIVCIEHPNEEVCKNEK